MKKNKWITILIAAILAVVVAITVVGCKPEDVPDDPIVVTEKSTAALKASLLSMSGFTEEITVEGANYDFKEQAIVLSLINNLCANIAASPMSQAKIDTLATTNFEGMEGPQDLLSLDLTEDDFVIVATAFYSAALTTFNNPALFDAAEAAATAYIASVPAETKTAYEDFTKYFIVADKLTQIEGYANSFTEADFEAAVALLASVDLVPGAGYEAENLSERFTNGLLNVVRIARDEAENAIVASAESEAAKDKLNALVIRGHWNFNEFGTLKDWEADRGSNPNSDANTISWLNTWLTELEVVAGDTNITIPADATGITNAWIASVSSELDSIVNGLEDIAYPHHDYARVAKDAQGIELGFEQSVLSNEVLSPKVQALFPELPVFMYRTMSLMENETLSSLFSDKGGDNPLSGMDPSQFIAIIDSINSTLTDLKAFLETNSVDLLALQGAIETLIQDEDFHLIAERFLPFYEGIGAIVSAGPNAIDVIQELVPIFNAENVNGIYDSLQQENSLALQMNTGIYAAKVIDAVYAIYQTASDFSETLSTIILDDLSGFAQLRALEAVGNTFSEMLPVEPVTITEDMMINYEIFGWAKEIALEARWETDPTAIEAYYTELQELPVGAVTATITDFSSSTEVDAYFAELDTYLAGLVEDETSGIRVALNNLITEALGNSPYALFVEESTVIQALAACTPVESAEDDNYNALRTALTDFVNIFVNAGLFNEGENQMSPIDNVGENTIENFMTNFMAGLFEGMLADELDLESVETILSETAPYSYEASLEGETTLIKIIANKTGKLSLTFSAGTYSDISLYHPNEREAGYWGGGTPSFEVYAGMIYYLEFSTDAAGELSMSIVEIDYQPEVE